MLYGSLYRYTKPQNLVAEMPIQEQGLCFGGLAGTRVCVILRGDYEISGESHELICRCRKRKSPGSGNFQGGFFEISRLATGRPDSTKSVELNLISRHRSVNKKSHFATQRNCAFLEISTLSGVEKCKIEMISRI